MSDTFTPEQLAKVPEYRQRALEIGLATGPCDREKTVKHLKELYAFMCAPIPEIFIFVPSYVAARKVVNYLTYDDPGEKMLNSWRADFNDEWVNHIMKDLEVSRLDQIETHSYGYGNCESYWTQYYKFFQNECGTKFHSEDKEFHEKFAPNAAGANHPVADLPQYMLDLFYNLSLCSGWHYLFDQCVVICDRPTSIVMENEQLHNPDGPAVAYSDGSMLYAIQDTVVPEKVVMAPETLTIEEINEESDMEVKRIMIERFGVELYLTQIAAAVVDMDCLPFHGSAKRALIRDAEGHQWLVGSDGSTGRVYYMNVPSEAETCQQAHEMISGLPESKCIGEC